MWETGFGKSQSLSIYSEVLIFINGVQTINLSAFDCLKTDCISSKEFGTEKVAFTSLQRFSAWSNIAFPRERLFRAQKCNDVRCILNGFQELPSGCSLPNPLNLWMCAIPWARLNSEKFQNFHFQAKNCHFLGKSREW